MGAMNLRLPLSLVIGTLSVLALTGAARAQGPAGPPPMDAKQYKAMVAYQPVFSLIRNIMSLDRLTNINKLTLTPAEKKPLQALLVGLAAKSALKPAEAAGLEKALNKALTPAHQKQLAGAVKLLTPPKLPPPPAADSKSSGPAPGGMFGAVVSGKPFNPFGSSDPITGQVVKSLIARLSK